MSAKQRAPDSALAMVPREPTRAMLMSAHFMCRDNLQPTDAELRDFYQAMVAAAENASHVSHKADCDAQVSQSEESALPEHDCFTVLFRGDLRAFAGNPFHQDTPFGRPACIGVGDAMEREDAAGEEAALLFETLRGVLCFGCGVRMGDKVTRTHGCITCSHPRKVLAQVAQ